ncbi:MAG: hypothetical protein ACXVV5_27880, partial [Solirubrobacteraceae bacterium]
MRRTLPLAVLSAVVLLLDAGVSSAVVSITRSRVVISGRATAAIVERSPFRLRVLGASGAPILAEVVNTQPPPAQRSPSPDPVLPGTDAQKSDQLYAPLSFFVGQQS